jgi:cyclophilin family peptidyl-prolyl cis-trans isomerase/HEAT repeat protein
MLLCSALMLAPAAIAQGPPAARPARLGREILVRIVALEDQRRYDIELETMLRSENPALRRRALLAAGRIGDRSSVGTIGVLLREDPDAGAREMAAFALGEIEAAMGARMLLEALRAGPTAPLRARIVEAIGKCATSINQSDETLKRLAYEAILGTLEQERKRLPQPEREVVLAALTAALRLRPPNAGKAIAMFLYSSDARVRADAANAMARMNLREANELLRERLEFDPDPVVRANAARALGAAEDSAALDLLLKAAADADLRVRVSGIRALGAIKQSRAVAPLLARGEILLAEFSRQSTKTAAAGGVPQEQNELLEIATALGSVLAGSEDSAAFAFLSRLRQSLRWEAPEAEVAAARVSPSRFVRGAPLLPVSTDSSGPRFALSQLGWRTARAVAAGLGEVAAATKDKQDEASRSAANHALALLTLMLRDASTQPMALADALRAYAAHKPPDLAQACRDKLAAQDVFLRATAADILGDQPPSADTEKALADALPAAMREKDDDAALAILSSLARQKTPTALEAMKTALTADDYLTRWRAAALLRENGIPEARAIPEIIKSHWTQADYRRALARSGQKWLAEVVTAKGTFTIELLPADAPLTVDNFIRLAQKKYFDGLRVHRVVPNFVIQDGDPAGNGSGGPGYAIRCEINMAAYDRGAVGMALSGKDTGGSQWFVTHSPQPHLDGGYTVFGRVIRGMEVVDNIARGDTIRRVLIRAPAPQAAPRAPAKKVS